MDKVEGGGLRNVDKEFLSVNIINFGQCGGEGGGGKTLIKKMRIICLF